MKYFLKKCAQWTAFLVFTGLFFLLPEIMRTIDSGPAGGRTTPIPLSRLETFTFEFVPGYIVDTIEGEWTAIRMFTLGDSSEKEVHLIVNGEMQSVAVVSGNGGVEFPRVRLRKGDNLIAVELHSSEGEVVAVRKARIFSLKKM